MDDEIKPLLYCRRPCNPKFHCCLWAARLGPVDKNQTLTQGKLDRALCNIEIWGLGVYLVGVCRVWSFCPSTVSWLYISYFKKVFLLVSLMHPVPTLQGTMTAKNHDCKAQWLQKQWLQRTMTAKKNGRKEGMTAKKDDWKKSKTVVTAKSDFGRMSRTKASLSHLQLAGFEGNLAQASIAQLQLADFEGLSHESFVFTSSRKPARSHLQLADFEGRSHESFLCTTSTCRFWRKSRMKTSFSSACS